MTGDGWRRGWVRLVVGVAGVMGFAVAAGAQDKPPVEWRHLSSKTGDLPVPFPGTQQTACLILDVDKDGLNDFVLTERTQSPSVVWYRRTAKGWDRYVVDDTHLSVEAGGDSADIDGDGDLDISFGGDASSNEVWWWENPHPKHDPNTPWKRRPIKDSGERKHHHQVFGDFDGDGRPELVFWNQHARSLCLARIPADPRTAGTWAYTAIYSWERDREHEGLVAIDVDGDGKLDIVGGGNWYRNEGAGKFTAHVIDAKQRFTRAAAGQFQKGGWAEVVFSPGDADGPLMYYHWDGKEWQSKALLPTIIHGHSVEAADFDQDGHLDIFVGEMGRWGRTDNPGPKAFLMYGDGEGTFRPEVVLRGVGNHESKVGDLDGDGDIDILGKPYSLDTPRVDIWLNPLKGAAAPAGAKP